MSLITCASHWDAAWSPALVPYLAATNIEQRRQFVLRPRTAMFGRAEPGPAMSVVYYSATHRRDRGLDDGRASEGQGRGTQSASLCVPDEQSPPTYLQVYCHAVIDTDFDIIVDVMMRIASVMAGRPIDEEVRPMVEEGTRLEQRVAIRLPPYATFYTLPKHVHSEAEIGPGLLHATNASIPW